MIELTLFLQNFFTAVLCIMMCVVFVCLVRAIMGPRSTDRVIAMNMIGSLVVMMICILSYLLEEAFLIDVAILYALLNMLVVVVLTRVAATRHYELHANRRHANDQNCFGCCLGDFWLVLHSGFRTGAISISMCSQSHPCGSHYRYHWCAVHDGRISTAVWMESADLEARYYPCVYVAGGSCGDAFDCQDGAADGT